MKHQVVSTLLMMSSMMGLTACGGGDSNSFVSSPSSGGGGGTGGTGGTVSNTGIYVNMLTQDQTMTTYLHKFYDFNTPCTISSTTSSVQDLECLLNVKELDLYQQGLKFEFNVPAGMCDYIADYPYWFYNREAGYGPKAINLTVNDQAGTSLCTVTTNDGTVLSSASGTSGVTVSGHTCTYPGGTAAIDGTKTCAYDYTLSDGPNCCDGSYVLNTNYTDATGTLTATAGTLTKWGGAAGNCATGPWIESDSGWKYNSTTHYPYMQIRTGLNGFNQYYKIKAPIDYAGADNTFAANFWDWTDYQSGSHPTSTLPLPMKVSTDRLGNSIRAPNPSYTFICYDSAMEIKQRVRLYINEWDTISAFNIYGTSKTSAGVSPVATGACDTLGDNCDDISGWQWWQTNYPTAYPVLDLSTR